MHDVQGAAHTTPPGEAAPAFAPTLDVVVPVYNEEAVLERSIVRLYDYLSAGFPFTWRIVIVDNASTDGTWLAATRLARDLLHVTAAHLDRKGRGLALRTAWTASDAAVVAYMDVDLSTDLDALLPLIAPLASGHSDLAIGSRLAPGSSVARAPKRELISRAYNLILRTLFATRVRDAQCGFKAVRADVARVLLPAVEDDGWFFDTELLLLAERNGLRIHEVPVDWIDNADSRVHVARTALDDLAGSVRMVRTFASGRGRLDLGSSARPLLDDDFGRRLVRFGLIGSVSTAISLFVFLLTRGMLGAIGANALAVSTTFVANTWANAHFTMQTSRPRWRSACRIYLGSLALTSAALLVVDVAGGGLAAQITALVITWTVATIGRLALVRRATRERSPA
jgi:glycosyltransferase involved in cell wall biosynthesis